MKGNRYFQGFFRSLIGIIKDKKEILLALIPQLFSSTGSTVRRPPFLSRKLALALKLLTFLGFARVTRNSRRQRVVAFLSISSVRNAIVGFLQNVQYTAKTDKKELKEKFDLICLKSEAEKFVDKKKILKESGRLFKPRTASFDLNAIDRFMKKNQNIVVPNTAMVLKRKSRAKETIPN